MYDYSGDMSYFQNQLLDAGITKDVLDMDEFAGSDGFMNVPEGLEEELPFS